MIVDANKRIATSVGRRSRLGGRFLAIFLGESFTSGTFCIRRKRIETFFARKKGFKKASFYKGFLLIHGAAFPTIRNKCVKREKFISIITNAANEALTMIYTLRQYSFF